MKPKTFVTSVTDPRIARLYRALDRAHRNGNWKRIHVLCALGDRLCTFVSAPPSPVVVDGLYMSMDGRSLFDSRNVAVPLRVPFDIATARPWRVNYRYVGRDLAAHGIDVFETIGYTAE